MSYNNYFKKYNNKYSKTDTKINNKTYSNKYYQIFIILITLFLLASCTPVKETVVISDPGLIQPGGDLGNELGNQLNPNSNANGVLGAAGLGSKNLSSESSSSNGSGSGETGNGDWTSYEMGNKIIYAAIEDLIPRFKNINSEKWQRSFLESGLTKDNLSESYKSIDYDLLLKELEKIIKHIKIPDYTQINNDIAGAHIKRLNYGENKIDGKFIKINKSFYFEFGEFDNETPEKFSQSKNQVQKLLMVEALHHFGLNSEQGYRFTEALLPELYFYTNYNLEDIRGRFMSSKFNISSLNSNYKNFINNEKKIAKKLIIKENRLIVNFIYYLKAKIGFELNKIEFGELGNANQMIKAVEKYEFNDLHSSAIDKRDSKFIDSLKRLLDNLKYGSTSVDFDIDVNIRKISNKIIEERCFNTENTTYSISCDGSYEGREIVTKHTYEISLDDVWRKGEVLKLKKIDANLKYAFSFLVSNMYYFDRLNDYPNDRISALLKSEIKPLDENSNYIVLHSYDNAPPLPNVNLLNHSLWSNKAFDFRETIAIDYYSNDSFFFLVKSLLGAYREDNFYFRKNIDWHLFPSSFSNNQIEFDNNDYLNSETGVLKYKESMHEYLVDQKYGENYFNKLRKGPFAYTYNKSIHFEKLNLNSHNYFSDKLEKEKLMSHLYIDYNNIKTSLFGTSGNTKVLAVSGILHFLNFNINYRKKPIFIDFLESKVLNKDDYYNKYLSNLRGWNDDDGVIKFTGLRKQSINPVPICGYDIRLLNNVVQRDNYIELSAKDDLFQKCSIKTKLNETSSPFYNPISDFEGVFTKDIKYNDIFNTNLKHFNRKYHLFNGCSDSGYCSMQSEFTKKIDQWNCGQFYLDIFDATLQKHIDTSKFVLNDGNILSIYDSNQNIPFELILHTCELPGQPSQMIQYDLNYFGFRKDKYKKLRNSEHILVEEESFNFGEIYFANRHQNIFPKMSNKYLPNIFFAYIGDDLNLNPIEANNIDVSLNRQILQKDKIYTYDLVTDPSVYEVFFNFRFSESERFSFRSKYHHLDNSINMLKWNKDLYQGFLKRGHEFVESDEYNNADRAYNYNYIRFFDDDYPVRLSFEEKSEY